MKEEHKLEVSVNEVGREIGLLGAERFLFLSQQLCKLHRKMVSVYFRYDTPVPAFAWRN